MASRLKYANTMVVFQELPDCTTLAINITQCPCACPGCHSSFLAGDIGTELTDQELERLVQKNGGIDAVCFMGGDINPAYINMCAAYIREHHPELTIGWYSGRQELSSEIDLANFHYIKLGPYVEKLGPLKSKTTNQRFYAVIYNHQTWKYELHDITSDTFWEKSI